ncbi:MAG TPA: aminoglycoside phosphotransferase family protein [Rhizomicrobium sp.]|jgi:aminoglycoside phosphotransferase (APT) family kinase protein|nr:aminoglycoside phosphotransferase family protein [Rhizomicrobium sp.]
MTVAVSLEQLQPVLRDLGVAAPVAATAMAGGSAPVFRIDLKDGTALVLKTYPDDRPWTPRKDAYAASLLAGLDLPVTRTLQWDESRTRLPFRFAIINYLPGATADALKDDPDIVDVYRQMGALLKRLHTVRMPTYGSIGPDGVVNPHADNAAFMRAMFDEHFRHFQDWGGDAALTDRLRRVADARFAPVTHSNGPVFGHDDMHPGNVLAARGADGRLRLTGLIDFGNARAVDPLFDLSKSIFCSAHMDPRSAAAIREGYGALHHPDPDGALWLYTLLHRVMMWWWIRRVGGKPDEGSLPGLMRDLEAMAAQ